MNQPLRIQQAKPAFQWRFDDCPDCNGGWVDEAVPPSFSCPQGDYRSVRCDECGGEGEIEQACECGDLAPLDDDGLCADCAGLTPISGDPLLGRL